MNIPLPVNQKLSFIPKRLGTYLFRMRTAFYFLNEVNELIMNLLHFNACTLNFDPL